MTPLTAYLLCGAEQAWRLFKSSALASQSEAMAPEPLGQAPIVAVIGRSRKNVRLTAEVLRKKHRNSLCRLRAKDRYG
jgi:hypothetical protein